MIRGKASANWCRISSIHRRNGGAAHWFDLAGSSLFAKTTAACIHLHTKWGPLVIYIYIYIHTCVYIVYMYMYIYIYEHIYIYISIYVCIYVGLYRL